MLPAIRTKEQRLFPGNRKPVLEVICPHQCNQPLVSLASISRRLLDGSPYGNAFKTRVVAHPEFAFGFSYHMERSAKAAVKETSGICAEKDAIVIFNISEGIHDSRMMLADVLNYGYIANKGKARKAKKTMEGGGKLDVRRRAIEKNGIYIVALLCYEAALELENTRHDQITIVPAYGFPAQQAEHNFGKGRAFIVNDLLGKRACGSFREGDFWMKATSNGATYFWLWE